MQIGQYERSPVAGPDFTSQWPGRSGGIHFDAEALDLNRHPQRNRIPHICNTPTSCSPLAAGTRQPFQIKDNGHANNNPSATIAAIPPEATTRTAINLSIFFPLQRHPKCQCSAVCGLCRYLFQTVPNIGLATLVDPNNIPIAYWYFSMTNSHKLFATPPAGSINCFHSGMRNVSAVTAGVKL